MTTVVICSKCRKLSLVPNTSTVFATCNLKFVQNFVLQAKKKQALQRPRKINNKVNRTNRSFNRNGSCSLNMHNP